MFLLDCFQLVGICDAAELDFEDGEAVAQVAVWQRIDVVISESPAIV